jgi:Spy/CpxP family protein refolding chaperone
MMRRVLRCNPPLSNILVLLLLTAVAFAQLPPLNEKWWKNSQVVKQLKLTTGQIEQIEKVMGAYRNKLINLKAELDRRLEDLSRLEAKEKIDESALKDQIGQIFAAKAELEKARTSMQLKIRDILTAEQRAKLYEIYKDQQKK